VRKGGKKTKLASRFWYTRWNLKRFAGAMQIHPESGSCGYKKLEEIQLV
jgi:hypothetical protein